MQFYLLLEDTSVLKTIRQLLEPVPIDFAIYHKAEDLLALCPATPSTLIFEYEVNSVIASDYIYELALQAGWSEIPWVLVAPAARLAQAKNLQATLPHIVDVVDAATPSPLWEPILEKLINHFPSSFTAPKAPAAPPSAPVEASAARSAAPLQQFKEKLVKHPSVEHFFVWDVAENQVVTSSPAALQFKEETQFALTLITKISEELRLGDILEIHLLAPDRFGAVFSVELSLPDRKAHAIGLISQRGFEARAVVASLRD